MPGQSTVCLQNFFRIYIFSELNLSNIHFKLEQFVFANHSTNETAHRRFD